MLKSFSKIERRECVFPDESRGFLRLIFMKCCFTGYRPEKFQFNDENSKQCIALKKVLQQEIQKLCQKGYLNFYTGMSKGVDTWAAEIVIDLAKINHTIQLHCAIPFQGQESAWSKEDIARYHCILDAADEKTIITPGILTPSVQKNAYLKRNRFMVDNSELVLAVMNLASKRIHSGTHATVNYAKKKGKKIVFIDSVSLKVHYLDASKPID